MATEGAAMYATNLLTGAAGGPAPPPEADSDLPPGGVSAPIGSAAGAHVPASAAAPNVAAATAAATAAAAAAAAQVQVPPDAKPFQPTAGHPAAAAVPPMAAATPFGQYAHGMVFAAADPTAVIEDQPTYVNPKQYKRILKRRESRKKQTGTDVTSYTPRKRSYMHESRHKHAMQRRRGPGGRFLSKEEREDMARQAAKEQAAAGQ